MKIKFKCAGDKAEVLIYDDIGAGFFGGITAKSFADELRAAGDISEINVRINSPGGSVFEGNAIYNALLRHKARIVVDVDGMALSIASVIAMAGDEIRMAENALMMIHNPFTVVGGTSKELRDTADVLDTLRDGIANTYVSNSSMTFEEAVAAMDAETWYTAAEAVEVGLAHSITGEMKVAAHFDLTRFSNAPTVALERAADAGEEPIEEIIDEPIQIVVDNSEKLDKVRQLEIDAAHQARKLKLV